MTGPTAGQTTALGVGDEAPDFDLPDSVGGRTRLSDLLADHEGVVVYFFPRAFTAGCTTEVGDFAGHAAELEGAGLALVGISRDEPERLAEFARLHGDGNVLASDADSAVHRAYGVLAVREVDGELVEKVRRTTFIVGPGRTLRQVWHDVSVEGHVLDVLASATGG